MNPNDEQVKRAKADRLAQKLLQEVEKMPHMTEAQKDLIRQAVDNNKLPALTGLSGALRDAAYGLVESLTHRYDSGFSDGIDHVVEGGTKAHEDTVDSLLNKMIGEYNTGGLTPKEVKRQYLAEQRSIAQDAYDAMQDEIQEAKDEYEAWYNSDSDVSGVPHVDGFSSGVTGIDPTDSY